MHVKNKVCGTSGLKSRKQLKKMSERDLMLTRARLARKCIRYAIDGAAIVNNLTILPPNVATVSGSKDVVSVMSRALGRNSDPVA